MTVLDFGQRSEWADSLHHGWMAFGKRRSVVCAEISWEKRICGPVTLTTAPRASLVGQPKQTAAHASADPCRLFPGGP